MTFLLITSGIPSCSQGWIVGNIPLTPQDTVTNTVFTEIVDADMANAKAQSDGLKAAIADYKKL